MIRAFEVSVYVHYLEGLREFALHPPSLVDACARVQLGLRARRPLVSPRHLFLLLVVLALLHRFRFVV